MSLPQTNPMTTNYVNYAPTAHQIASYQTANYSHNPSKYAAQPSAFALPHTVCDMNLVRHQLSCPNLTALEILSMARDALLHGAYSKIHIYGQLCHQFIHQKMIFVLSEGFDAVVTIVWHNKDNQIIGDQSASSFPSSNTNHSSNAFECMIDEECIDEIVNHLDQDMMEDSLYPSVPMAPYRQNTMSSDVSVSSSAESHSMSDIKISNALYVELNDKLFGSKLKGKQELVTHVQTAIRLCKAPMIFVGDLFCVWFDAFYVYCTLKDEYTLCDIFDRNQFENNYQQCYESLINRVTQRQRQQQQLLQQPESSSSSKRSVFSDMSNSTENKKKGDYHAIYIKPIIERMKAATAGNTIAVDTDYIVDIVDNSIKYGVKRQISKRTFEFKWSSYTIIMSKSLKTILDVTVSQDADVITVHPDVVSIISKKCPVLDYVTIQRLANRAKVCSAFTTKKNDYRQQFIYDFSGCRIVFASNHTTIVEMQCNDAAALNDAVCDWKC